MFTKLLKKLFTPTRQKDEHLAFYEDIPEPEIAVFKCTTHIKFKKRSRNWQEWYTKICTKERG